MENERFTDQNWEDLKDAYSRSADDLLAPPPGYDPFWGERGLLIYKIDLK